MSTSKHRSRTGRSLYSTLSRSSNNLTIGTPSESGLSVPNDNEIIQEGYLHIRLDNKWKKRYFRLYSDRLEYSRSKRHKGKDDSRMFMSEDLAVEPFILNSTTAHRPFNFVVSGDKKAWFLSGEDGVNKKLWLDSIAKAKREWEEETDEVAYIESDDESQESVSEHSSLHEVIHNDMDDLNESEVMTIIMKDINTPKSDLVKRFSKVVVTEDPVAVVSKNKEKKSAEDEKEEQIRKLEKFAGITFNLPEKELEVKQPAVIEPEIKESQVKESGKQPATVTQDLSTMDLDLSSTEFTLDGNSSKLSSERTSSQPASSRKDGWPKRREVEEDITKLRFVSSQDNALDMLSSSTTDPSTRTTSTYETSASTRKPQTQVQRSKLKFSPVERVDFTKEQPIPAEYQLPSKQTPSTKLVKDTSLGKEGNPVEKEALPLVVAPVLVKESQRGTRNKKDREPRTLQKYDSLVKLRVKEYDAFADVQRKKQDWSLPSKRSKDSRRRKGSRKKRGKSSNLPPPVQSKGTPMNVNLAKKLLDDEKSSAYSYEEDIVSTTESSKGLKGRGDLGLLAMLQPLQDEETSSIQSFSDISIVESIPMPPLSTSGRNRFESDMEV